MQVARAADDCGNAICSLLPPPLCIKVLSPLSRSNSCESVQACLKMLTNAINRSTPEELTNQIVSDLVPGLLQVSIRLFFAAAYLCHRSRSSFSVTTTLRAAFARRQCSVSWRYTALLVTPICAAIWAPYPAAK